jgi:hypothetical protein
MSDLLTIGKFVIDWLLAKGEKRTARVDEYLKKIQSTCIELVEIEDPLSDKAALLHEEIKVVYELAAQRLPRALIDREGWDLYRGLSSARIYFWTRVIDSAVASGQLREILLERQALSSSSFDALLQMLPKPYSALSAQSISEVRNQCLKDIARILELRPFF